MNNQQKVIIVGASSDIGRGTCKTVQKGCLVGVIAGRSDVLQEIVLSFPQQIFLQVNDVTKDNSSKVILELVETIEGLDLLIPSAGTGELNHELDYHIEHYTNQLNVYAFT